MCKKIFAFLLVLSLLTCNVFAVNLFVNGQRLIPDAEPVVSEGRTLVPMRAIFEALNAQVTWDNAAGAATAVKGDRTVQVTVNAYSAYINGEEAPLDVPAQIIQDRTFVPVRFVAEALNAEVSWDGESQTVYIDTDDELPAAPVIQPQPQAPVKTPQISPAPSRNPSTVYVTKTGKRYHYSDSCNGGTYYPATLEEAKNRGLTPCNKCVN